MIESSDVLSVMKVVYIIYGMIIFSFIGMYALGISRSKQILPRIKVPFYGWIGFLVFVGVGLHLLTYHTIPWVKLDLSRNKVKVDKEFNISIADYKFQLPDNKLLIEEGQMVRFNLESKDYTYGFGLFREDGTMVFQMQVVPESRNDIVWKFNKKANYTIRSTEYAGPRGGNLFVKNAVIVATNAEIAQLISKKELLQN